jgi:hypothetical protein
LRPTKVGKRFTLRFQVKSENRRLDGLCEIGWSAFASQIEDASSVLFWLTCFEAQHECPDVLMFPAGLRWTAQIRVQIKNCGNEELCNAIPPPQSARRANRIRPCQHDRSRALVA